MWPSRYIKEDPVRKLLIRNMGVEPTMEASAAAKHHLNTVIRVIALASLQLSIAFYGLHTLQFTPTLLAPLFAFSYLLWCKLPVSPNENLFRQGCFFGINILHLYYCGKYAAHSTPDTTQLLLMLQGGFFCLGADF